MTVDFGFSPCPNDTFMFWAWVHQLVSSDLKVQPQLADIQELNELALGEAPWALTKVSIATYLEPKVQENYKVLGVGAALGRGCGPLIVSKEPWSLDEPTPLRIAIPGRNTTAFKLTQMALRPWLKECIELRYDKIMPAVLAGEVDAGVIIHESRFTYQGLGLTCALDLGQWWEQKTGLPLPLGVMVGRRDLDAETIEAVERTLHSSIALAWKVIESPQEQSESLWGYLRANAIELDDETIRSHIDLYVNEYSSDLGQEGPEAISEFSRLAKQTV